MVVITLLAGARRVGLALVGLGVLALPITVVTLGSIERFSLLGSSNLSRLAIWIPALVIEVVSPGKSDRECDRETKFRAYASAGIPFYLLVDRFAEPVTITLFSEPGQDGYGKADAVASGPGGGELRVPDPFGIVVDATTMPMPREFQKRLYSSIAVCVAASGFGQILVGAISIPEMPWHTAISGPS